MTCPFQASPWLRDLIAVNIAVDYHVHGGSHDMGGAGEIKKIADFLQSL